MDPLGGLPLLSSRLQAQHNVNAADDQHSILCVHFAGRIRCQSSCRCIDLTRLQRASEGSGQSTRRGGYDVVECGRMWFRDFR